MGRLSDLIARDFGVAVDSRVDRLITAVGTATTMVLPLDPDRLGAWIINLSPAKMTCGFFRDVAATKGIVLGPNGGRIVLDYRQDFLTVGLEWFIRSTKANSRLTTIELIASS